MENGKFIEKLRIDPATPSGMKGSNFSHYHLNGNGKHLTGNWPRLFTHKANKKWILMILIGTMP